MIINKKYFSLPLPIVKFRLFLGLFTIIALSFLNACATNGGLDMAGLSGSASMQIDVEVYKGPLSKEIGIQASELIGKTQEGKRAFGILKREIEISMARLGCTDHLVGIKPRTPEDKHYKICPRLQNLFYDAAHTVDELKKLNDKVNDKTWTELLDKNASNNYRTLLDDAVKIAEWLRSRAAFWATDHAAVWPDEKRVRIEIANFAQFASDYGNQIGSRSDALLKQIEGVSKYKVLQDQIANSVYLRDSSTTRYLDLYDWNNASVKSELSSTDRVRLVEQLIRDTYWSRINRVFASGQGDVRMAFIKDEIGNWNLKNFDNDPAKLLQAYKDAGLTAVSLITKAATAGEASVLLNMADRIALGNAADGNVDMSKAIDEQRTAAIQQVDAVNHSHNLRITTLNNDIAQADSNVQNKEQELTTIRNVEKILNTQFASMDEGSDAYLETKPQLKSVEKQRRQLESKLEEAKKQQIEKKYELSKLHEESKRQLISVLAQYENTISALRNQPVGPSLPQHKNKDPADTKLPSIPKLPTTP